MSKTPTLDRLKRKQRPITTFWSGPALHRQSEVRDLTEIVDMYIGRRISKEEMKACVHEVVNSLSDD